MTVCSRIRYVCFVVDTYCVSLGGFLDEFSHVFNVKVDLVPEDWRYARAMLGSTVDLCSASVGALEFSQFPRVGGLGS